MDTTGLNPAVDQDLLERNLTRLVQVIQGELTETKIEVAAAKFNLEQLENDTDRFFLLQMAITVFCTGFREPSFNLTAGVMASMRFCFCLLSSSLLTSCVFQSPLGFRLFGLGREES